MDIVHKQKGEPMSDLIDRQAAIDEFEKELSAKYNRREFAIGFVGIKRILENLPSAQPETRRWILCSERLPEPYHRVILTIRGTDMVEVEEGETLEQALKRNMKQYWVTDGYLADDGWNGADGFPLVVNPVAWMEFPEPWKGEEDA